MVGLAAVNVCIPRGIRGSTPSLKRCRLLTHVLTFRTLGCARARTWDGVQLWNQRKGRGGHQLKVEDPFIILGKAFDLWVAAYEHFTEINGDNRYLLLAEISSKRAR
ncbi:hypothetical protein PISMIDRAFT_673125 [Pisolithus microcarpus 441]|uniref:Uncharacterized protein n=1 Tax=Pisolithus microcarpus 441 TaxID=765257 RepID=A0A0D0A374_9AGAM|nr:hypothetical protein BKA83DRAFT_673125 [Pisolithus microcarpus]KIK28877.1 hypothetical protein PISMIDRAFT_673125 [Pisolithus microcarpus 441]